MNPLHLLHNPERSIYKIDEAIDLTRLVSIIDHNRFSTKTISIGITSAITNADLRSLFDALKSKPKAASALKELWIVSVSITELPDLSEFHELQRLYLEISRLTSLPNLENLPNLKYFHFATHNAITCSGSLFLNNKKLLELYLSLLRFTSALDLINNNALEQLSVVCCGLQDAPSIEHCTNLSKLELRKNKIEVPPKLNGHKKLTLLDLSENLLIDPPEVDACPLIHLFLHENKLRRVPSKLPVTLKTFHIQNNLVELPPDVANCKQLEYFNMSDNRLLDAPDLSKCGKLKIYTFRNNPLTLSSKIYLMQLDMKKIRMAYSFDLPYPWREGHANHIDLQFLARAFKSLPKKVIKNLIDLNFLSNYEQYNYEMYYDTILAISMVVKSFANWEKAVSIRILGFLLPDPTIWLDHGISMIRAQFVNNQPVLEIIDYYVTRFEEPHKETTKEIIQPRITAARNRALLQFERTQQNNANPYNLPAEQPINQADNKKYNRITASRPCVIS